jgi:hypothetical protein
VVEARLEGFSFSVPICVVTEVCHLCTYVDYFNRNTIFSFQLISCKYLNYYSMGIFVMYVNGLC